jgi:hypothetical protein
VRGRIILRTSEYIKTPFVFGLIKPLVILPETDMSADEKRLAFIHELTHIKNGDLWLKFSAFVLSVIHWFNPFAHLLRRKISVISEEYCDECVVKAMTKDERFLYGSLILKVISDIAVPQAKFCSTLSAPTRNIKRRLSNMMNLKKSRKSIIALSIVTTFVMCSFATLYAFAATVSTSENSISDAVYMDTNDKMPTFISAYTNEKGEIMYSVDNQQIWLTEDKFKKAYPDIQIEWWTYNDLKAWIETIKHGNMGDSEFSKEIIDATVVMYELLLEDMKNGLQISKIIGYQSMYFDDVSNTWAPTSLPASGDNYIVLPINDGTVHYEQTFYYIAD